MPKFRSSHSRASGRNISYVFRLLVLIVFLTAFIIWGLHFYMDDSPQRSSQVNVKVYYPEELNSKNDPHFVKPFERCYIPNELYELIHHRYYSLGYDESIEQARWVSYELTGASLKEKNVERTNWYMEDGLIKTGSASYYDFKNKNYSRGHLAPAADMAFNEIAMKESFLLSNMSPQNAAFNRGVWNELEQNIRQWASLKSKLQITTGPLFYDQDIEYIGSNKVAVPHAFYKVILDKENGEGIGFIIPNAVTDVPLSSFAYTIDVCEHNTGLDFFQACYARKQDELSIESDFELENWPMDQNIYHKRVNVWNKNN